MKTKSNSNPQPRCVFCGGQGRGFQFNIFTPRFKPFGTACVSCEKSLPPGTIVPIPADAKRDKLIADYCARCGTTPERATDLTLNHAHNHARVYHGEVTRQPMS